MKFKSLAVAALAVAASSAFADDIVLTSAAPLVGADTLTVIDDAVLVGLTPFDSDTAVIIQEGAEGSIAVIDQFTVGGNMLAAVVQTSATKAVAYIAQSNAAHTAVINQHN